MTAPQFNGLKKSLEEVRSISQSSDVPSVRRLAEIVAGLIVDFDLLAKHVTGKSSLIPSEKKTKVKFSEQAAQKRGLGRKKRTT